MRQDDVQCVVARDARHAVHESLGARKGVGEQVRVLGDGHRRRDEPLLVLLDLLRVEHHILEEGGHLPTRQDWRRLDVQVAQQVDVLAEARRLRLARGAALSLRPLLLGRDPRAVLGRIEHVHGHQAVDVLAHREALDRRASRALLEHRSHRHDARDGVRATVHAVRRREHVPRRLQRVAGALSAARAQEARGRRAARHHRRRRHVANRTGRDRRRRTLRADAGPEIGHPRRLALRIVVVVAAAIAQLGLVGDVARRARLGELPVFVDLRIGNVGVPVVEEGLSAAGHPQKHEWRLIGWLGHARMGASARAPRKVRPPSSARPFLLFAHKYQVTPKWSLLLE